jgi:hypothetical protein
MFAWFSLRFLKLVDDESQFLDKQDTVTLYSKFEKERNELFVECSVQSSRD